MEELGLRYLGRPLQDFGWRFGFDRARRRLGRCLWEQDGRRVRRITLSGPLARHLGWAGMEDAARHEIAHALDYETRGESGHDAVWRAWARRCGARPERLARDVNLPLTGARYVGICPHCARQYPFYRRLRRPRVCARCCDAYNAGNYAPAYVLRIIPVDTMPESLIAR